MKKRLFGREGDLLVALLLFFTLLGLGGFWINSSVKSLNQRHLDQTRDVATVQASGFELNLMRSISGANILGAVVVSNNGGIADFEHHASIIFDSLGGITNLQLAPDGIVKAIFPIEGHEQALGHNLLKADERRKEANLAIKTRQITVAGPFNLIQGGRAIVARNPIFIDANSPNLVTENSGDLQYARQGDQQFWGYSSVLIYFDTLMAMTDLPNLEAQGYQFRLWRKHPDTGMDDHLAGATSLPADRIATRPIELPNAVWHLEVAAKEPAITSEDFWLQWLVNILFATLLSGWCYNLLQRPKVLTRLVAERTSALEEAQAKLRLASTAFESHEAITITDVNGRIMEVNSAFSQTTGYAPEEVIGKTNALLHSGMHDDAFYRGMWQVISQKGHWHGEIWNRRKDGEVYPAWLSITAVTNHEDEISHYVGHCVDISKRIKAEAELNSAKEKAETANRAKADFLAMMSHEIRTPLNGVMGLLALLRDTYLDDKQQRYVNTARESGQVLLTVIDDILDFSKMEAGELTLEQSALEPQALLDSVYGLMKPKAEAKGISFDFVLDAGLPAAFLGDSGRIRQILFNLINNAIKFTEQGKVELRLSAKPLSKEQCQLRCEVTDTGIGIEAKDQAELFEQFKTVDPSYARKYGGTGLGLSICKRLVELMGGQIGMTSTPGSGSTFWFELEVTQTTPSHDPVNPPTFKLTGRSGCQARVLVVDDVVANRMVARGMLENAGHRVEEARNGFEALHWLQHSVFDLVLMDISMPDMDGLQATAAIRQLPGIQGQVFVIAMTAHAMQGDRERFLAAGMNDYLAKPLNRDLLLEKVALCCEVAGNEDTSKNPAGLNRTEKPLAVNEAAEGWVDRAVLEKLAQDTSPDMLPELSAVFIGDASERLQRIGLAVSDKVIESLKAETHALGSSAACFGLTALHRQARQTEKACKEGSAQEALAAGAQLLSIASDSLAELEQIVRDWTSPPK